MNFLRISICAMAAVVAAASNTATEAATMNLFTEDLTAFDAVQDLGDGTTFGVEIQAPVTPFNDGNAVRLFDFATADKPELQGELSSPLLEPFRIDFQSLNQSTNASSSAIRFRMGNSGQSITSESRVGFSLSWQADGKFSAKYSGVADANPNDIDTKTSSGPLVGVHAITMIANGATAGTYAYSLFGESRTLNPLSYDVYIDGVLFNDSPDADFANGMLFHFNASGDYDKTLGLQRFGLVGSSDANVDPDVLYDNILLRTGSDILVPEPGSITLVLAGSVLMLLHRRYRA